MSLADTQRLLRRLIVAPQGVVAGLRELEASESQTWGTLVCSDDRLSAAERLDIYANMYFYRLRDCLRDDFAAVHAVIGADHFHNLMTDYLLTHPPSHFSLRYAGRHLPAFLTTHPLARRWEFLPELARFESAILEAFDAPDATVLTPADLVSVPADEWADLRLTPSASLQLLEVHWPVHRVWQQVQNEAEIGELNAVTTWLRIWRRDLQVFHVVVDSVEYAALLALRDGAPFGEICDAIATLVGDDTAARRSSELLSEWVGCGVLVRAETPNDR
ncbi:MAG: putative DNA-binding domain-containing protein [Deltaproteobacteria bacterium]|nr:putative DNA-binding domain-containing protein [Deltaproteobacteria bacterium]